MIVTRSGFDALVDILATKPLLAIDTETTGLRMYQGDRLFSIIIADSTEAYYFNFIPYQSLGPDYILGPSHLYALRDRLFVLGDKTWFIQNAANFDLCILGVEGLELNGQIHCTKAIGRVEYNDHFGDRPYSLDAQLARLGHAKDDAVKKYVDEHNLHTDIAIPGKGKPYRQLHYDRVPWDIIVPYGETDGRETYFLGITQIASLLAQDQGSELPASRSLGAVMINERRLQKTIYRMKHRGVLIDRPYCERASKYELDRSEKAAAAFKRETGSTYSASPNLFKEVFASEKAKWQYTDNNNPSFTEDVLTTFASPAAKLVLELRDAKSKSDFYNGFLWFADAKGRVHPDYDPAGTVHGRLSSSQPNFQNLTSEDDAETLAQEFVVRRAIIPTPGYIYIMPDYDQMEYKFMLEQACRIAGRLTPLGALVAGGFDFHESTCNLAKEAGSVVVRKQAKIANFLTLYGGGVPKLAAALGVSTTEAQNIRDGIFRGAPEIGAYIRTISGTAKSRGYIINWLGRRCHFPNKNFAYRAPNYHISGGCADIVKVAMNRIDDVLLECKSRMTMTVHDELPIEVHESEIHMVPKLIKQIMEESYTAKYIPMTCGMEWSAKSLGDKIKGFPL